MEFEKFTPYGGIKTNSKKIAVHPNQKYRLTVPVSVKKGQIFASYIMVQMKHSDNDTVERKIRWITDFSGNPKDYSIIFTVPSDVNSVTIGYRVNYETLRMGEQEIHFPEIDSLNLQKENETIEDSFDTYQAPPLPEHLTEEQLEELEKRMVWILGSVRSGSTWLALQLLNVPENISWNEPMIGKIFNSFRALSKTMEKKNNGGYFFAEPYKHCWVKGLRRMILERAYTNAYTTNKNIIIKEPGGSAGADKIMEYLPHSKMIFLLRDGRDVVDSMIDALQPDSWWKNASPIRTKRDRAQQIEQQSKIWRFSTETVWKAYQSHSEQLRMLVKYEDLRKNTYQEVTKIYEFIGINATEDTIKSITENSSFEKIPSDNKGKNKFARLATPGSWQEKFSKKEQNIMNDIMGPTLKKVGYVV